MATKQYKDNTGTASYTPQPVQPWGSGPSTPQYSPWAMIGGGGVDTPKPKKAPAAPGPTAQAAPSGYSIDERDWARRREGHQRPAHFGGGGGNVSEYTRVTKTDPASTTTSPFDMDLYEKAKKNLQQYETEGLTDISEAQRGQALDFQRQLETYSGSKGFGAKSPHQIAAVAQGLIPFHRQMAISNRDAIQRFKEFMTSAYSNLVGQFTKKDVSGTTTTQEQTAGVEGKEKPPYVNLSPWI